MFKLEKKLLHFYFLSWDLHSYWDLTAQRFWQQQGHCLFSPQQVLTNSREQVKKCMLFLLLYHFSVQRSCVLPENVRGNSVFFTKRLLWQTLGNKNSWAGENIHALISNMLSKLHRNPHLHCFWWSNLTTREKVAGSFRKYKILLWIFLLDLLKVQNAPCPCKSMCSLCCLHSSPLCPRERQSHKVDVAVGIHTFSSVSTILLSLNHLFPKWTLIAQHLSATTLIRSVLQKKRELVSFSLFFSA